MCKLMSSTRSVNLRLVRSLSESYGFSIFSSTAKDVDIKIASALRNTLLTYIYTGVMPNFQTQSMTQEDYFKPFNVRYGNDSFDKIGLNEVGLSGIEWKYWKSEAGI